MGFIVRDSSHRHGGADSLYWPQVVHLGQRSGATRNNAIIDSGGIMVKVNEAGWDRGVRIVLGIVMLVLGWGGFVDGWLGVAFQWLGFVPLLTGIFGWCPIYALFHFQTKTAEKVAHV
jgi:hypothetical protein